MTSIRDLDDLSMCEVLLNCRAWQQERNIEANETPNDFQEETIAGFQSILFAMREDNTPFEMQGTPSAAKAPDRLRPPIIITGSDSYVYDFTPPQQWLFNQRYFIGLELAKYNPSAIEPNTWAGSRWPRVDTRDEVRPAFDEVESTLRILECAEEKAQHLSIRPAGAGKSKDQFKTPGKPKQSLSEGSSEKENQPPLGANSAVSRTRSKIGQRQAMNLMAAEVRRQRNARTIFDEHVTPRVFKLPPHREKSRSQRQDFRKFSHAVAAYNGHTTSEHTFDGREIDDMKFVSRSSLASFLKFAWIRLKERKAAKEYAGLKARMKRCVDEVAIAEDWAGLRQS